MDTLIHADIFFFITTIAVILLTILCIVAGFYIIQILRNMRDLSDTLRHEGTLLAADIAELRQHAKEEGLKAIGGLRLVGVMIGRLFRRSRDRGTHNEESDRHRKRRRSAADEE